MIRKVRLSSTIVATGILAGCGSDDVAGRSTTTTNGDGVVAIGPGGIPVMRAYALYVGKWDSLRGTAQGIDTVLPDPRGILRSPMESFAFLEINDPVDSTSAWLGRDDVFPGGVTLVRLAPTREVRGRWLDHATTPGARVYIDRSLRSSNLGPNGEFRLANIPLGTHVLRLADAAGRTRPMGVFDVSSVGILYSGAANLSLEGQQQVAPFWIDDFETETIFPKAKASLPAVSRWYMLVVNSTLSQPRSTETDTLREAFLRDPTRGSRVFETKYTTNPGFATVGLGATGFNSDLSERSDICLSYRSDRAIQIEFHREKIGDSTPVFKANLDSSSVWRDACVGFSSFQKVQGTPDSLGTWTTFGRNILTIHVLGSIGSTFLALDDIRIR